jgi:Ca2+-binding EF-hand superfamily protein
VQASRLGPLYDYQSLIRTGQVLPVRWTDQAPLPQTVGKMNQSRRLIQFATIFRRSDKVQRQLAIRRTVTTERMNRLPEWNDEETDMKKAILISSATAMLMAGGIAIAAPGDRGMRADTNGDGVISRAEMTASLDKHFARMDANGDGQLSPEDRAARHAERFAKTDTNGDGELSPAEIEAARAARKAARFARMDKDGNGTLSPEEAQAMHGKRGGKGMHDGMRGGMRGHRGGHGMAMMRQADSNGDQKISKAEFTAAAMARFDKADANKDGKLTKEERQAAWQARRGEWNKKGG